MKRKIYFIIYSVIQFIMSIVVFVNHEKYAKELYDGMQSSLATIPEAAQMFNMDSAISVTLFTAGICASFAILFFILTLLNKVVDKKKFAIFLIAVSLFICCDEITSVFSLIALVLVCTLKKEKVQKEKKELKKLKDFKITYKEILLGVLLILVYLSQFVIDRLPISGVSFIVVVISYYLVVLALSIFVFRKRLVRDLKETKKDFGTYFKYIFKMWVIMIVFSLIAAVIRIVLGADGESANQLALNGAPLWYVVPLSVIWAPIVEECVFRGTIRRFVSNDKLFIVISAITFGLIHTIGQEVGIYNTLLQSLQYIAMGGVMAYTYTKTNNIFTNMGVHCIQNTFASLMMIFVM